ncbi:MAG: hypothetical protein JWO05_2730 [Gemmatimonadetes bacterium]|nr:hypothetical protein [Gemmatimonadota bacterium]
MKALFLTHSYPRHPGDAAGNFVLRLAVALRAEGVDVRVVAPHAERLSAHEDIEGIAVERFRYAPKSLETLAYTGNMASQVRDSWSAKMTMVGFLGAEFSCAVKLRREWKPDVVHAHWWFPNGLVGTWLHRMAHVPLVTTLHGTDVRLARSIHMSRPAFRHVLKHSAVTTAVSRWLASEATEIVSSAAPLVAPMPVATDLFSLGGTREQGQLLFVGRLMEQKGLDLLLGALTLLPAQVKLDVIGDGEQEKQLHALATSLGLSDRVRWLGALPQAALAEHYRRATALVVPSQAEGLGLVAVEAALCGTPTVAFASGGGIGDVVHDGRTGALAMDRTKESLAAAIRTVIERDDQGMALGEAGRLHALGTFAPEAVAKRYADIYRTAIGGAPR